MNYSNSNIRLGAVRPQKNDDMVLTVETDKRGTHLRVRKGSTILKRALRPLIASALLAMGVTAPAQFAIDQSPGLFTPSFRDAVTFDGGNTTWFGWQGNLDAAAFDNNGFDGLTNNELIDGPAVLLGLGGRDGTLNQVGSADILADASNNVFAGDATNSAIEAHLTLQIPTSGVVGSGFTTIILQGNGSVTGTGTSVLPLPGAINGISAQYTSGLNSAGRLQWWAKYELPGNADSYQVDILLPGGTGVNPVSIRQLVADTQWSSAGYAPDSAVVPEPGSGALLACVAAVFAMRRRVECVT